MLAVPHGKNGRPPWLDLFDVDLAEGRRHVETNTTDELADEPRELVTPRRPFG
jgi:hypothetical protein